MMRWWAIAACSCVASEGSALQIANVLAPPTSGGAVCAYATSETGPFLSYGTLDVAFADTYTASLLVLFYLNDSATFQSADVQITDASGAVLATYTTSAAGTIANDAPSGIATVTLVDQTTGDAMRAQLSAGATARLLTYVTIHGMSGQGRSLVSNRLLFPVNVCDGCLVVFPLGSDDPSKTQPNCLAAPAAGETPPCIVGQDQPIDCRSCQSNPVCVP